MTRFFLILVVFALFACKGSGDDYFAIAYVELRIAEKEYGDTEKGDTVRSEILQRYEMDADVFKEKINKIKSKPDKWLKFQNRIIAVLDSIENNTYNEAEK